MNGARAIQNAGPGAAEYNAPVIRRNEWLAAHPGGTIGRPRPGELGMEAAVIGTVLATAYDDLGALMDQADKAEAEGRCPLHLHDGTCRAVAALDSWYEENTGRIAILEREFSHPVVAVCRNCFGRIRRASPASEWEHVPGGDGTAR